MRCCSRFEARFSLQALQISVDGDDRQSALATPERDAAISRGDAAVDLELVPADGVPHVRDGDVVVSAPEKGHEVTPFALAEHVAGGDLALALRDDPVFDTDCLARM